MSSIFVGHDLKVVRLLCERMIMMRAGRIAADDPTAAVLAEPKAD